MRGLVAFLLFSFLVTPLYAQSDLNIESEHNKQIHLGTWATSPFWSADGSGLLNKMMEIAFRRCCNLKAGVTSLPSERSLKVANLGIVDGELPRIANISGANNRYPNLIQVEEAILPTTYVAFTKNPTIKVSEWAELEPYHVAIITGWKILERNIHQYRSLTKVKNQQNLFAVLDKNRVDVAIVNRLVGLTVIREMGLKGIYGANSPTFKTDKDKWYLYMHKKHRALIPKLNLTLREMKSDGTFLKIYCEGLSDYVPLDDVDEVIKIALNHIGVENQKSCNEIMVHL